MAEAGDRARGATAYVTLRAMRAPWPHAAMLQRAYIGRHHTRGRRGGSDPDERVAGKGYAVLRAAGIEVAENVLAGQAADQMAGYSTRSLKKRPEVTLKLAVSADGMIGRQGVGQVAITGAVSRGAGSSDAGRKRCDPCRHRHGASPTTRN